jgi:hypothetical protein
VVVFVVVFVGAVFAVVVDLVGVVRVIRVVPDLVRPGGRLRTRAAVLPGLSAPRREAPPLKACPARGLPLDAALVTGL